MASRRSENVRGPIFAVECRVSQRIADRLGPNLGPRILQTLQIVHESAPSEVAPACLGRSAGTPELEKWSGRRRWDQPAASRFRTTAEFGGTIDIMRVTIQLPDDISAALEEQWDDVPRRSLEAIAVEAYRTGALTESQVRRLLGLESRFQVHAVLKEHHVPLQYTAADLEDDLRAQRDLGICPG